MEERREPGGLFAEDEDRRWPALILVLARVTSFPDMDRSRAWRGDAVDTGGGEVCDVLCLRMPLGRFATCPGGE